MLLEEAVSLIHRFSFATYVAQHILFSSSFLLLFVFQNRQNILSSLNNPTLPSCEDFSSTLLVYLNCLKKSPREMFALQRHNASCIVLILLCLVFVFVYLCICVFVYFVIVFFVFVRLTHESIIFDILEQSSFQKYTTCWEFLALFHMLYLCICVFVFVYLCMRHLVISILISLNQELSENLWFVWSKTS